jgi:predicted phosphodiesterase
VRVAVVSDIHGNRQAFEAVLHEIGESSCQEMWCLGDLVGYGADPDACVELARKHAAICLAGNHDLVVRGELPLEEFSRGAALAARWTQQTISAQTRAYLNQLAPVFEEEKLGLYHASPRDPVWEYVLSPLQAELCLDVQKHRTCLIGHSHVALSFCRTRLSPATGQTRHAGEELEFAEGEWLINPGSVGQPRDGDPRAAYALYNSDASVLSYCRVGYDVETACRKIRDAGLPAVLADRLSVGR